MQTTELDFNCLFNNFQPLPKYLSELFKCTPAKPIAALGLALSFKFICERVCLEFVIFTPISEAVLWVKLNFITNVRKIVIFCRPKTEPNHMCITSASHTHTQFPSAEFQFCELNDMSRRGVSRQKSTHQRLAIKRNRKERENHVSKTTAKPERKQKQIKRKNSKQEDKTTCAIVLDKSTINANAEWMGCRVRHKLQYMNIEHNWPFSWNMYSIKPTAIG